MADKDKIMRCLDRWGEVSLLDAVKELGLDEEESGTILELVMQAVAQQEKPERKPALMAMVREFCDRQGRMEEQFERMVAHLEGVQAQLRGFVDAIHMLTDVVHPGSPENARTTGTEAEATPHLTLAMAETKIVNLANRRPPSWTPPEPRKGA